MKKLIIVSIFGLFGVVAFSQSKTEIKNLGIKSETIWNYDYTSGKEVKKIESVTKYNEAGLVVDWADYDKAGKLKERITYTYNSNGDVIEEKYFDSGNKLSKTYKYTYKGVLKQTKEKYDASGKMEWKKMYLYEM